MPDDRPYIEIQFTGTTLTQIVSDTTLIGTDIVIDYGDGTIINYTGNYSHTYNESGSYTIRIYGVTSLGNNCFYNCSDLTSVIIPNSVTSIGYSCFRGCHGLTSIIIPSSVTSLGNYCFRTCNSLISVIISESVKSIGAYCFNYCPNLTNIQLKWASSVDILTYNSNWINDATNSNLVFIIPQGTTSLYEAKGYPTAKLVERIPNVSSYELFNDVKRLFLNNKEVKSIVIDETDGGIIYERTTTLITTNLTIEVPALVYSDVFDITGLLTDDNNNPISGASVKLYRDNNILEATETTDNNGEVTFHRNAPTTITTYTFQLIFDGDSDYNNSSSSVVTRKVNAETTILNLTSPLNNATYNEGETIPIAGTITTDDGEQLSSENPLIVTVYDENNNRLTVLPIVNGAFSRNITAPSSAGNHSITVKFEGASTALLPPDEEPQVPSTPDEEPSSVPSVPETEEPPEPQLIYAPSEVIRSYTVTPDSLTLTSNKNILSQADNDVATLTATYNANDNSGKVVTFSGAEMTTTVSSESWLPFGNEATVSNIQMGNLKIISLGRRNNCLYISRTSSTQYRIYVLRQGDTYVVNDGKIDISQGFSYSGDTFTYTNNTGTVCTFDISGLDKQLAGDSNVSFTVTSSTVSTVTDSNGVASVFYNSQGAGDVTIIATCESKQATCNISDYPAIYIDNCDGTQKQIFTTTAEGGTYKTFSYTTYQGYQCLNHNTNFAWYPPSNSGNMLIEFDMYPAGSWGGTSIKGANGTRLVWYMQGSQYNDMSYQIAVLVPSQWNKCKILIQDGVVTAWLNNNQIGQITTTVTHPLVDEMGSGTNPCYIKNLKIIELP